MLSWDEYLSYRVGPTDRAHVSPEELRDLLSDLTVRAGFSAQEVGRSVEGRPIQLITAGNGPRAVLLWSQMHGDEPTHTRVLLTLLSFFLRAPRHECVQRILGGCTLHLLPMLNPDGAARHSRYNAWDIDINRDARKFATPEGQALRRVVLDVRPEVAFNLHNQNRRTTLPGEQSRVAAVSLLVPPVDALGTETENTVRAKRLAAFLRRFFEANCDGMISRYDADYMPRAFGEWVQGEGVATLLIEAGGWPTGRHDELVHAHLAGLLTALSAIATDAYLSDDVVPYESLPRSSTFQLVDVMLHDVYIVNGNDQEPFQADVGINFTGNHRFTHEAGAGVIEKIGDLKVRTAGQVISEDLFCVPGRVVFDPRVTPVMAAEQDHWNEHLLRGITTVIGPVDVTDPTQVESLVNLKSHTPAVNLGFLARCDQLPRPLTTIARDQLIQALAGGALGVLAAEVDSEVQRILDWFQLPQIGPEELPMVDDCVSLDLTRSAENTQAAVLRLGLARCGRIRRETVADLLLFRRADSKHDVAAIPWADLKYVLLGGYVVYNGTVLAAPRVGRWFTSRS